MIRPDVEALLDLAMHAQPGATASDSICATEAEWRDALVRLAREAEPVCRYVFALEAARDAVLPSTVAVGINSRIVALRRKFDAAVARAGEGRDAH